MAEYNHKNVEPLKGASAIAQWVPVKGLEGSSSIDETVIAAGSFNDFAIGLSIATVASPGDPAAIVTDGRAKAIAGASLGAFTPVAVGSTNGILIPIARGAVASAVKNAVGYSLHAAAAGDIFTIFVKPEQIV